MERERRERGQPKHALKQPVEDGGADHPLDEERERQRHGWSKQAGGRRTDGRGRSADERERGLSAIKVCSFTGHIRRRRDTKPSSEEERQGPPGEKEVDCQARNSKRDSENRTR